MRLPLSQCSRRGAMRRNRRPRVQQARKHAGDYDPPRLPSRGLGRSPEPAVAAAALDEDVAAEAQRSG
jgi:hypothetical protein